MISDCFLYSYFFQKDNENLLKLDFKSTDNTKFSRNGDYYAQIMYNDLECHYIIDYALSNDDRFKYNPLYVITKGLCKIHSEVIIFEIPYDGLKEVICFPSTDIYNNQSITFKITYYDEMYNIHNLNGYADNYIEIDRHHNINCYGTYYIRGKEFDSKSYHRFLKIKKIKNEII